MLTSWNNRMLPHLNAQTCDGKDLILMITTDIAVTEAVEYEWSFLCLLAERFSEIKQQFFCYWSFNKVNPL